MMLVMVRLYVLPQRLFQNSLSSRYTVTVSFAAVDKGLIRKCRYNTLDPTKVESTATEKEVHGRREEESRARICGCTDDVDLLSQIFKLPHDARR